MAHARPFWTSTLWDLSNGIKNTPMWDVLSLVIEFWVFGSPGGLPSPIFGSVSGDLTLPSKWGCNTNKMVRWDIKLGNPNVSYPRCIILSFKNGRWDSMQGMKYSDIAFVILRLIPNPLFHPLSSSKLEHKCRNHYGLFPLQHPKSELHQDSTIIIMPNPKGSYLKFILSSQTFKLEN